MKVTLQRAYELLGVAQGSTEEEARSAYRKLALKFHPDKNPHEEATAKFQEISAAYKRICDFHKRGGNQRARGSFFHDDDDDDDGEEDDFEFDDVDLEDLELSFEEMLMMFEMMFGPTKPSGKSKAKSSKKGVSAATGAPTKTAAASGKVPVSLGKTRRRKAPGGSKMKGGKGGLFGGRDDPFAAFMDPEMMMFEQFMGMSMDDPELDEMGGDMMEEMMHLFAQTAGDDLFGFGGSGRPRKARNQKPRATASSADVSDEEEIEEVSDWEDEGEETSSTDTDRRQADSADNQDESKHDAALKIEVGSRVMVSGKQLGTARFVGPAHYSKGVFIGVELDEPEGKNDGTLKGVAYFECKPRHGLMVRPEDVTLACDAPPHE